MTLNAKKLCIVLPTFRGGGAEKIGISLANHFSKTRPVTIIVFNGQGPYRKDILERVSIHDLKTKQRNPYRTLAKALRQESPDAVLSMLRKCNTVIGISRFFYSDYRLVLREANTLEAIREKHPARRWKSLMKMKLAYRQADSLISNSQDALNELHHHGIFSGERGHVIGNPINLADVERKAKDEVDHPWLDTSSELQVIITVGRLHQQKNQDLLIRAFSRLQDTKPDARLILIGQGNKEGSLKQLTEELNLGAKVSFLGFQENPYAYIAKANAFVLTSRREGFPNVLIEAMACRTPVVATNCPGAPKDMLGQGAYGMLVENYNVDALAYAMLDTLSRDTTQQVERARQNTEQYTLSKIAENYAQVLKLSTAPSDAEAPSSNSAYGQ